MRRAKREVRTVQYCENETMVLLCFMESTPESFCVLGGFQGNSNTPPFSTDSRRICGQGQVCQGETEPASRETPG